MVMDLLGPNLTSARRSALGGALELTAAKVGRRPARRGSVSGRVAWAPLPRVGVL